MNAHATPPTGPIRRGFALAGRAVTAITGPLTRKNVLSWVLLIALVLGLRWLVYESYTIPSGSMEPTLHGDERILRGDHLGVDKLLYGPRLPFTKKRLFHMEEPKRWDIVVFKSVEKSPKHPTLVKRIVGLPGERIHIQDGKICVNGAPVEPPEPLRDVLHYSTELNRTDKDIRIFTLQLAQSHGQSPFLNPVNWTARDFYIQLDKISQRLGARKPADLSEQEAEELMSELNPENRRIAKDLFGMYQKAQYPLHFGILSDDAFALVPEDCYLVCGDNSGDSVDGRYFGWVPNGNILGRAFCIWWPITRWRDLTGFSRTWYGAAFLYGVPVLLIALECVSVIRRRTRRQADL